MLDYINGIIPMFSSYYSKQNKMSLENILQTYLHRIEDILL